MVHIEKTRYYIDELAVHIGVSIHGVVLCWGRFEGSCIFESMLGAPDFGNSRVTKSKSPRKRKEARGFEVHSMVAHIWPQGP